jgi:hypothetical protein
MAILDDNAMQPLQARADARKKLDPADPARTLKEQGVATHRCCCFRSRCRRAWAGSSPQA